MSEHTHSVNAATCGLSALPGTARPFAATKAMNWFLNHEHISFHALLEPAQDNVRTELATSNNPFALVVHDWSMFGFNTHKGKRDRYQRSHETDLGYELGSALVVDADDGRPLGPMELRLRTTHGMLSTRIDDTAMPPGHVDELLDAMNESRHWNLGKTPIHIIDREADSVGHYRTWQAAGHQFLVRADDDRFVLWQGKKLQLTAVVASLSLKFQDVLNAKGQLEIVTIQAGTGRVRVAETEVVLHRPASKTVPGEKTAGGHKKKIDVPGPPITLRLIVTRVVDEFGKVLAEWCLLTNVNAGLVDAATIGRWYASRWRIELQFRTVKQTVGRKKLRSRTPERALVELDWALLGLWLIQLLATKEQIALGEVPEDCSASLAIAVIRSMLANGWCRSASSFEERMGEAQKDSYKRTRPKSARYRPDSKDKPSAGKPKIQTINRQQMQRITEAMDGVQ